MGFDIPPEWLEHSDDTPPVAQKPKRVTMPANALALDTFDFSDMLHEVYEPLQWIIPQYLPEGLTLLFARPKVGKSMTCLALALRVARQTSGGVDGETLYLLLDDTSKRRLQDRTRSLLQGESLEANRIWGATKSQALDTGLIDQLEAWMTDHPSTRLIVVDVYARVKPKADDDVYKSDYNALVKLQEFAVKHHIAIILVHHTRKASTPAGGDWIDSVNGSTGLTGAVDTLWMIERAAHSNDLVLHVKGRDTMGELEVGFSLDDIDAPWKLRGDDVEEETLSAVQSAIIRSLTVTSPELTPRQLADVTGVKYSTIRGTLRRMLHKNLLGQTVFGSYCLPSVTSYTEKNSSVTVTASTQQDNMMPALEPTANTVTPVSPVTRSVHVTPINLRCPACDASVFTKDMWIVSGGMVDVCMARCAHCRCTFNADGAREKARR